jgi:ATPase subunit of ABC transporter with duplicated ATPase domains
MIPTNHLDFRHPGMAESFLQNRAAHILIVSHDRNFLDRTVDTLIEIENIPAGKNLSW